MPFPPAEGARKDLAAVAIEQSEWEAVSGSMMAIYIRKNREYGDGDLHVMGKAMDELANIHSSNGWKGREAAILFYILGKVARATNAIGKGNAPSSDTILDLAIYSMMLACMRAQSVGLEGLTNDKYNDKSREQPDVA